jgi:CHAD domain-containing protein
MFQFVSKKQAIKYLEISETTLKRYRQKGVWTEGIHWVRLNSRCIRYNLELIQDWFHNRCNPKAHQKAIEAYQASLLSEQRTRAKHLTTKQA